MKIMAFFATLLSLFIMLGCSTNKHYYSPEGKCISCWNNPITGQPINHDGNTDPSKISNSVENKTPTSSSSDETINQNPVAHKISFTFPVNVDVAYLKIKKEFSYYTDQEILQEWGSMADMKLQTFAFTYSATPSVNYHMRADRMHEGISVIIDSQIEKRTDVMSKITLTYWLRNESMYSHDFSESLKQRTIKALGR